MPWFCICYIIEYCLKCFVGFIPLERRKVRSFCCFKVEVLGTGKIRIQYKFCHGNHKAEAIKCIQYFGKMRGFILHSFAY